MMDGGGVGMGTVLPASADGLVSSHFPEPPCAASTPPRSARRYRRPWGNPRRA